MTKTPKESLLTDFGNLSDTESKEVHKLLSYLRDE